MWSLRTQVSALLAHGHPYDVVMEYPLGTIWSEFKIIRLREGGKMASESTLMQSMLTAWFSGKPESYNKLLGKVQDGG